MASAHTHTHTHTSPKPRVGRPLSLSLSLSLTYSLSLSLSSSHSHSYSCFRSLLCPLLLSFVHSVSLSSVLSVSSVLTRTQTLTLSLTSHSSILLPFLSPVPSPQLARRRRFSVVFRQVMTLYPTPPPTHPRTHTHTHTHIHTHTHTHTHTTLFEPSPPCPGNAHADTVERWIGVILPIHSSIRPSPAGALPSISSPHVSHPLRLGPRTVSQVGPSMSSPSLPRPLYHVCTMYSSLHPGKSPIS
ncbi:hypothetical protein LX32DRAFT_624439 [Colletotrichum zoysiae]|uniref:Uncharacterized protein n=1 Tax=Colletotrichum zoysiae TaxID=1216348 RepID=A0AAD9LYD2_9PEZI|nr:hypothetical protein LX32DRAFT_624439 [Colletotrichum zoysiae]